MKGVIPIIIAVFFSSTGMAQIQDSIELKSVIISAEKPSGIPALKSQKLDSMVLQVNQIQNLGTLLQNNSSINVKSYGSSGIQTITFRGMSASHTKVYVNGLDMSPASLGQTDLSIVPKFLFSGVAIQYGNSAFTQGPGAIGGGVMLQTDGNKLAKGNSLKAGFSYGSFGKKIATFEHGFKAKNWTSTTRYIYQGAENNFEFKNIAQPNSPKQKQAHSKNSLHGFSHVGTWDLDAKNCVVLTVLGTFSKRDLPALMTDTKKSVQNQNDGLMNTQLGWVNYGLKSKSNLVLGYTWSKLIYDDSAANIHSVTINNRVQAREDYTYNLNTKWAINTTVLLDYSTAYNANYSSKNNRFQGSVLVGANGHLSNKWEVGLFIQPTVNNADFVLLPMASVAFLPTEKRSFIIGANLAQNAHFATLNDLFWTPGGNPDLLPEKATNAELNLHLDGEVKTNFTWNVDLASFYGVVNNWILWQPSQKAYWEAQNIKTVEHSGAEGFIGLHQKWNNWRFDFTSSYQFVNAINKGVEDASLNKQLIYTPQHSANWLVGANYKKLGVMVNYNYTGKRYITTDNTTYLPAYDLVNLVLTYQIRIKKNHVFDVQFDVNNVLGKEYMSVVWRAMPGTNYMLTLRYGFK